MNQILTIYFSKLIRIADSSGHLDERELYFGVLIEKIPLDLIIVYFGFVVW